MKKRTARILTGIGIFLVALAAVYAVAVAVSATRLRRAYAEIAKADRPLRAADIIPSEIPDAENAALLYESAALLLKAQPAPQRTPDQKEKNLLEYLGSLCASYADDSIEPNGVAELQELIRQDVASQAVALVAQGTRRPACRFDRDYANGLQVNPFLRSFKALSRILGAKVRLEAQAGQPAVAWRLAQTQLKLSDALRQEPSIISQLVRMATIRLSCETIQKLCETSVPDIQQSQALAGFLQTLEDVQPVVRATDGERLLVGEWLFKMPKHELQGTLRKEVLSEDAGPDLSYWLLFHRIAFRPSFLADHAAYLRIMSESTRMMERPYSPDDLKEPDLRRHKLTSMLMPAIWRIKELHVEMIAQARITRAGLALLQYRQNHGAFPPTLDTLGLKGLADPFVEQPLGYRAEGESFLLYSVGKDQKDNGGTPKPPKGKADFDIVWRFPAGPKP